MKTMDDLLKQALTPRNEPDYWLSQNTVKLLKEAPPMKKMSRKKYAAVTISCALFLCVGSISAYAAWKYLRPDQVATELKEDMLADAFSEENAVYINETQSFEDYDITLLGITSGERLSGQAYLANGSSVMSVSRENETQVKAALDEGFLELTDRSYLLFAVENKTQAFKEISEFHSRLSIFPVVMGYDYETYSGLFENAGGGQAILKDGVIYYLYECNSLEPYADHAIYMCVSDDIPAFSEYSYRYDSAAGTIARNEQYEGVNALFSLPMDASKADPKAAETALKKHQARLKALEQEPKEPLPKDLQDAYDFIGQITPENIREYATPLTDEGARQTFGPADAQGRITIDSSYPNGEFRMKINVTEGLPNGKKEYVCDNGLTDDDLDTLLIEHFILNDDGTITLQYYKPNIQKKE